MWLPLLLDIEAEIDCHLTLKQRLSFDVEAQTVIWHWSRDCHLTLKQRLSFDVEAETVIWSRDCHLTLKQRLSFEAATVIWHWSRDCHLTLEKRLSFDTEAETVIWHWSRDCRLTLKQRLSFDVEAETVICQCPGNIFKVVMSWQCPTQVPECSWNCIARGDYFEGMWKYLVCMWLFAHGLHPSCQRKWYTYPSYQNNNFGVLGDVSARTVNAVHEYDCWWLFWIWQVDVMSVSAS